MPVHSKSAPNPVNILQNGCPANPALAAFYHSPIPTLAFERNRRVLLLWNPALQQLAGFAPSGQTDLDACLAELFGPAALSDLARLCFEPLPPGQSRNFDLPGLKASGAGGKLTAAVWDLAGAGSRTFPKHCRIIHFLPQPKQNSKKISPAQTAARTHEGEPTLAQYQLWLDLALDSVNNGLWTMKFTPGEPHYRSLVFTSPNALRMLGYSPEDMPEDNPLTWDKLTHPDDFPETLRRMREHIFEAKTDHYEAEFRVKTKDGRWQWLRSYGRVTRRDKRGNPLEAMGTHLDIDRLKQTEENLQKSEFHLRTLVDNMPLGLMLINEAGGIDYINPQFSTLFGYSQADFPTLASWLDHAYPNQAERTKATRFRPSSGQKSYMSPVTCADGSSKITRTYQVELPFELLLLAYEDVTSQVYSETALLNREQELREKSQKLEETNTALRVVLNQKSSTQNELKSTLYIGLRDLILPELDGLAATLNTSEQGRCLGSVRRSLNHLADLCHTELSLNDINLTRREQELAELIRDGMTSKHIAAKLGLTESAIDFHRNNLRKKLGIAKKPVNLKTYLKAMPRAKNPAAQDSG